MSASGSHHSFVTLAYRNRDAAADDTTTITTTANPPVFPTFGTDGFEENYNTFTFEGPDQDVVYVDRQRASASHRYWMTLYDLPQVDFKEDTEFTAGEAAAAAAAGIFLRPEAEGACSSPMIKLPEMMCLSDQFLASQQQPLAVIDTPDRDDSPMWNFVTPPPPPPSAAAADDAAPPHGSEGPENAGEIFYAPLAVPPVDIFLNEDDDMELGNVRRAPTVTDSRGEYGEDVLTIYPRGGDRGRRAKIPFVHFPSYMTQTLWSTPSAVDVRLETGFLHFRRWRTLDPCLSAVFEGEHRFLLWALTVMAERMEEQQRQQQQQQSPPDRSRRDHHHDDHHHHRRPFACFLRVLIACHQDVVMVIALQQMRGMIIQFEADPGRWLLPLSVVFESYDSGAQYRLTMTQPDGLGTVHAFSTDGTMAFQHAQQITPFAAWS